VVGLHGRTMELFELRGQAHRFAAVGRRVSHIELTHGGHVDLAETAGRFPYISLMPQSTAEDILATRALELGVEIIPGAEVVDVCQDDDAVTIGVRGTDQIWQERAAYLVGCDGADSAVRRLAGIAFHGSTYEFGALLADVRLGCPPGHDMVMHLGQSSVLLTIAGADGTHRVAYIDAARAWTAEPPTPAELRAALHDAAGRDLRPDPPTWLGRLRLHKRVVANYRRGRILLAGDAAHLHSPVGGQGITLAVEDAVNLGWKLAAVVGGWAPAWLLDSYDAERRPVAENVVRAADRATQVLTRRPSHRELPGWVFSAQRSATEVRYQAGGHPVAGRPVPDVALRLPGGRTVRPHESLHSGQFLLLDLTPDAMALRVAGAWSGRVRALVADAVDPEELDGVTVMIVRPDGYVAWSTRATSRPVQARLCRSALTHWCGQPGAPAQAGIPDVWANVG
jgi:2-polyprenyl-6-methoxyphenol hydroxylase-like FAD-dependent oxidoreductase